MGRGSRVLGGGAGQGVLARGVYEHGRARGPILLVPLLLPFPTLTGESWVHFGSPRRVSGTQPFRVSNCHSEHRSLWLGRTHRATLLSESLILSDSGIGDSLKRTSATYGLIVPASVTVYAGAGRFGTLDTQRVVPRGWSGGAAMVSWLFQVAATEGLAANVSLAGGVMLSGGSYACYGTCTRTRRVHSTTSIHAYTETATRFLRVVRVSFLKSFYRGWNLFNT